MPAPRVLFDGGPLCRAPLSAPALGLLDLIVHLPPEVEPHIALPDAPPAWLPSVLVPHRLPAGSRMVQEQRQLPALARRLGAALHLTAPTAPLFGSLQTIVSPAGGGTAPAGGAGERLRRALGRGGTARAQIAWPADVPLPAQAPAAAVLPPAVHPAFAPHRAVRAPSIDGFPGLPESYFLVHTEPSFAAIRTALEAWTWAAGPIGDVYPLVFLGLPGPLEAEAGKLSSKYHLRETIRFHPPVEPPDLPLIYRAASAVLLPGPIGPWSSPLRYGMASGIPVVGIETPVSSAVAGPAAYLVPPNDPRSFGAALIAVIVKDDLRRQLVRAAEARTAGWSGEHLGRELARLYSGEIGLR